MRPYKNIVLLFAALATSVAVADATDDLILLDQQWGESGWPSGFVSEDVISIGPAGIVGFNEMVADADAEAEAEADREEAYVVSGYQVKFLSDDIAVMVHTAAGSSPHSDLHVFQKLGDTWLVMANAAAPITQ